MMSLSTPVSKQDSGAPGGCPPQQVSCSEGEGEAVLKVFKGEGQGPHGAGRNELSTDAFSNQKSKPVCPPQPSHCPQLRG